MNRTLLIFVMAIFTCGIACADGYENTIPQQVPIPTTAAEVPGPVFGSEMTADYVKMVGRMAYVWGYAMVNTHTRRAVFSTIPSPCLVGGTLPFAPVGYIAMLSDYIKAEQRFIVCPSQDVIYGAGFIALDKEPTVFQVPEFGDRFWVYGFTNARTDEIANIGRQYGTKSGFYMIVGANWKGEVPDGITAVVRSSTELVFCVPRVFKDTTAEDTKAVQSIINQIMFYPLSEYDGKMKTTDWSKLPHVGVPTSDGGESKFVKPKTYYKQLPEVMKLVPPLPGEEAIYSWINSVWDAASKDRETKKALEESFVEADKELVAPLFHFRYTGRAVGNGWTSPVNASRWGTDYLNRTAISKASMYVNTQNTTKYQYKESDSNGRRFNGNNQYTLTFPKGELPPVIGFWSLTLYDENHFFTPNALNRYSLGTKSKSLQYNEDGSLTLYFGVKSPGQDKESNWLPAPQAAFSLLLRNYWPEKAIIDGTWLPPDVLKLN
jgi:hypothetical protein